MESYLDKIIETTRDLISYNSVQEDALPGMPFGRANYECLVKALDTAKSLGFKTKNLDGYCGYAELGEGEDFGILAHLDIVPAGDDWSVDPFQGRIIDGIMYGRGILDDKGPVVCCMYAIKKLLDENYKPTKKIRIIFGCNEESGWKCIDHYNKAEAMPKIGFSPDADFPVIYLEKGIAHYKLTAPLDVFDVKGGHRPNMVPDKASLVVPYSESYERFLIENKADFTIENNRITVKTSGKSAHGSTPEKGDNAIIKLFALSNIPLLNFLKTKFENTDGSGVNLKLSDAESKNLSLNLGAMNYKDKKLEMLLDIRYPVKYAEKEIQSILKLALPDIDVELINDQPPLYIPKDNPLVTTLLSAYNKVTGENASPIAIGGGTYARALEQGVAFGPIFPDMESTIHQKDERVSVANLLKISKIYYEAIKAMCFE